ncbi:putative neuropilin-1-like, partial [Homarus americanus]
DFDMVGPLRGDCTNDTFVVLGANQGSNIPTLCGINTGQHMYLDIDNSDGPFKLVSTMSAFNYMRRWKIKVTFIDEKHPCKTPFRCLQYFTEPTGAFSSFNFGGSPSQMLNGQMYSICFGYVPGYCDIGINYNRYDLGNINGDCGNDYTANAGDKLCVNATGPISLTVFTDDNNEREEEGFSAAYMMMAC